MEYIHIKNLEKYNPGYTDRTLIWCKIYFSMINSSYEFENMDDIDKWRLIALIMLELQMKKPIPLDLRWLQKKLSNNKRPISLTLKMLHGFLEYVTEDGASLYRRVEKSRVEKSRVEVVVFPFDEIWNKYPNKDGKKKAEQCFHNTVKDDLDWKNINKALNNYLNSERVSKGFVKNGSTWFNNWADWVNYKEENKSDDGMGGMRELIRKAARS